MRGWSLAELYSRTSSQCIPKTKQPSSREAFLGAHGRRQINRGGEKRKRKGERIALSPLSTI